MESLTTDFMSFNLDAISLAEARKGVTKENLARMIKEYFGYVFGVTTEQLQKVQMKLSKEMQMGLERHNNDVEMLPSFIVSLPTGTECGNLLALDFGGSNLRICRVLLKGSINEDTGEPIEVIQHKVKISDEIKNSSGKELFDFIANTIKEFLAANGHKQAEGEEEQKLGFCFSFPVTQTAVDNGKLVMWNKGFNNTGVVNENVVELLQQSLNQLNLKVKVVALVNDTIGTLLASAYKYPNTIMGVIFGTGTNCAYIEKIENIKKLNLASAGKEQLGAKEMGISIEWGALGNDKVDIPITSYDNKVDRESLNPGSQIFEKLVSGMYLGEIVRNCLIDLTDHGLLFNGKSSKILNSPYSFQTNFMSRIETAFNPSNGGNDHDASDITRRLLEDELGIYTSSLEDRKIVELLCHLVGLRSARLAGGALAAVLSRRMDLFSTGERQSEDHVIGVDGSLFEHYPNYEKHIMDALAELLPSSVVSLIKLHLAKDGSSVGAALAPMLTTTSNER